VVNAEGSWQRFDAAVPADLAARWLAVIDDAYRSLPRDGADYVAESSSFRLRSIRAIEACRVWEELAEQVRRHCVKVLGPRLVIDVDECWVRRQYPPSSAPPRHHPHAWHQDGALRFAFFEQLEAGHVGTDGSGMLQMVTIWLALTPCGVDAPGLELIDEGVPRLVGVDELRDEAVATRWPPARRTRPVLDAGDALVFEGDLVHRTHVEPSMTSTRTSIELRLFGVDRIAERLRGDTYVDAPADALVS